MSSVLTSVPSYDFSPQILMSKLLTDWVTHFVSVEKPSEDYLKNHSPNFLRQKLLDTAHYISVFRDLLNRANPKLCAEFDEIENYFRQNTKRNLEGNSEEVVQYYKKMQSDISKFIQNYTKCCQEVNGLDSQSNPQNIERKTYAEDFATTTTSLSSIMSAAQALRNSTNLSSSTSDLSDSDETFGTTGAILHSIASSSSSASSSSFQPVTYTFQAQQPSDHFSPAADHSPSSAGQKRKREVAGTSPIRFLAEPNNKTQGQDPCRFQKQNGNGARKRLKLK